MGIQGEQAWLVHGHAQIMIVKGESELINWLNHTKNLSRKANLGRIV